jgi:hypothetical protein
MRACKRQKNVHSESVDQISPKEEKLESGPQLTDCFGATSALPLSARSDALSPSFETQICISDIPYAERVEMRFPLPPPPSRRRTSHQSAVFQTAASAANKLKTSGKHEIISHTPVPNQQTSELKLPPVSRSHFVRAARTFHSEPRGTSSAESGYTNNLGDPHTKSADPRRIVTHSVSQQSHPLPSASPLKDDVRIRQSSRQLLADASANSNFMTAHVSSSEEGIDSIQFAPLYGYTNRLRGAAEPLQIVRTPTIVVKDAVTPNNLSRTIPSSIAPDSGAAAKMKAMMSVQSASRGIKNQDLRSLSHSLGTN